MENILTVKNLQMSFGGIVALSGISFNVQKGTITALIGPNGAGKTTVFNCVTGFYKATKGELHFNSKIGNIDIRKVLGAPFNLGDFAFIRPSTLQKIFYHTFGGTHIFIRQGLARTFQNIRLFKEMTLVENLLIAQHNFVNRNIITGLLNTGSYKASEKKALENAFFWLEELNLLAEANLLASQLPYGKARRLELARAMCTNPTLICLDEPAAGLNPKETEELSGMIVNLRDKHKVSVFLIEHDMSMVMKISEKIIVLDHGVIIAEGDASEIKENPKVIEAYLGTEAL